MFIKDPCGVVCILITYAAILYADYVVVKWIILQTLADSLWAPFHAISFNLIAFLLLMAHCKAVFCDPGSVPLPQIRIDFSDIHSNNASSTDGYNNVDWTICTRCETYRPPRAHHCRICRRCIRRMDHHCPWINNCVGERNQKYFIQFLLYVGALSGYAITLSVMTFLSECATCDEEITIKQRRMMHCVILLLESSLFGLFVIAILADQLQAIMSDETAVEQVQKQGPFRPHKPKMALLSDVCGRQHPLMWLLPCTPAPRKLDSPLADYHV